MSTPVRTLALWCPDWPVVAQRVPDDQPAAVLVANRVLATNIAARHHDVTSGLRRRDAQGRCPDLLVLERDEAAEARAFEPVVVAIEALTPRVELTRPGRCLFATRGPSRYWGGDDALAARTAALAGEIVGRPGGVRIGIAEGPFAAQLAARGARDAVRLAQPSDVGGGGASQRPARMGEGVEHSVVEVQGQVLVVPCGETPAFLAPHPLRVLGPPALMDVLRRLGLRTLGDLAALPAADVVGRFGAEGRAAQRLAAGLDERPPALRRLPPDLEVTAELDPPALLVEPAAFVARGMAAELHEHLEHLGLACTRIAIEAETEHGERHVRLWRHEGALSAAMVAERVRWQLDGWLTGSTAHRPTAGISLLRLMPDEVIPADGRQLGFWGGTTREGERAARALARVQGLLGIDAVQVPERRGGRQLAEQVVLVPLAAVDLAAHRARGPHHIVDAPWPGALPIPSPATLHVPPQPIEVRDVDGATVRVSGRGECSATPAQMVVGGQRQQIDAWAGPWPVEERWWDRERQRRQARFQVVTASGVAHLVVLEGGSWWLVATYD